MQILLSSTVLTGGDQLLSLSFLYTSLPSMFYLVPLLIKISSQESIVLLKNIFKNTDLYILYDPE